MIDGRPGDDPILDVTEFGLDVYTDEIDDLIRDVWPLLGSEDQEELRTALPSRDTMGDEVLDDLKVHLQVLRARVREDAQGSGWEVPPETD